MFRENLFVEILFACLVGALSQDPLRVICKNIYCESLSHCPAQPVWSKGEIGFCFPLSVLREGCQLWLSYQTQSALVDCARFTIMRVRCLLMVCAAIGLFVTLGGQRVNYRTPCSKSNDRIAISILFYTSRFL